LLLLFDVAVACTDAERAQFVALWQSRAPDIEGGPRFYRLTLERIDNCIALSRTQQARLNAFLATVK